MVDFDYYRLDEYVQEWLKEHGSITTWQYNFISEIMLKEKES